MGKKLIIIIVSLILFLFIFILIIAKVDPDFNFDFKFKIEEASKYENRNQDGNRRPTVGDTNSAFNLLLLSDPRVNQYVKDYFKITTDVSEGKVFDANVFIRPEAFYGINMAEQGVYANTALPVSYLPLYNNTTSGIKPYGSLNTLFNYNTSVKNDIGYNTCDGDSGWLSAFQISVDYLPKREITFHDPYNGGNGFNSITERDGDLFYFPDQLYAVNKHIEEFFGNCTEESKNLTGLAQAVYSSVAHNRGSGSYTTMYGDSDIMPQVRTIKSIESQQEQKEFIENANQYGQYYDFKNILNIQALNDMPNDAPTFRMLGAIMLAKQGWSFTPSASSAMMPGTNYSFDQHKLAYKAIYNVDITEEKYIEWITLNTKKLPEEITQEKYGVNNDLTNVFPENYNDIRRYGTMFKIESYSSALYKTGSQPVLRYADIILIGHNASTATCAGLSYGKMLKWMGLDVDPTNPSTYLNSIPEGQYIPGSGVSKPTGNKFNILPSKDQTYDLAKLDKNSLAYYFVKKPTILDGFSPKALLPEVHTTFEGWSSIGSVGEKDGIPLYDQWAYETGVVDPSLTITGIDLGVSGCGIFTLSSAIHGIGFGKLSNPGVPALLKEIDLVANKGNGNGFIEPWELNIYLTKYLPVRKPAIPQWHEPDGMTGQLPSITEALGLPVQSVYWNRNKTTDLEVSKKLLQKGYPFLASFNSPEVKMYEITNLDTKTVKFKHSKRLTSNGHYVLVYTYNTYKDEAGNVVEGVTIIDSTQSGRNNSSNYIIDINSLYDAKTKDVPCTVIKLPLKHIGGNSVGIEDDDTLEKDYYLDDTLADGDSSYGFSILSLARSDALGQGRKYSTINLTLYGNAVIHFEGVSIKISPKREMITFKRKPQDTMYYELYSEASNTFNSTITESFKIKFVDILLDKNVKHFTLRKFVYDSAGSKQYLDMFENTENKKE